MAQVEFTGPITPFGNLIFGAGITAAFAGSDSKAQAQCARGVNQNTTPNFIGGTPTDNAPRVWSGFRVFGPNASKLVEHDAAGTSRTLELRDENNNLIATATAADQTAQVWENMSFTALAPFVSPRVVLQGTVVTSGDGMDVARLHLFYQDDGSAAPPPPPPAPTTTPAPNQPPTAGGGDPREINLAFGQSHMEGPAPIQDQSAYYYAGRCDNFGLDLTWRPPVEPLNPSGDGVFWPGNMSSAFPFVDERAKLSRYRQGILLRARGSQSLTYFAPGTTAYSRMVSDMLMAKAASPAGSRFGSVVCWQGESGPSNWDQVFLQIVNAMRIDLSEPELPFAFVIIDTAFSAVAGVQKAMALPFNVARVRLDDLPSPGATDNVYPAVHREVGRRLAWATMGMHRLP